MKKVQLTKAIASLLIAVSALALNSVGANAEWKQDSNGWWNTEGSSWSVGWKQIDGKWYCFGQDGYMVYDTIIDGYKLGSDGVWIESTQISPPQIFKNYDISSDEYNKGWKHSANGWWNTEQLCISGWQLIEGKYYYFGIEGGMQHDTTVDGYYLGADGAWDATKGQSKLQHITMKTEKSIYALGTKDINVYITNNTNLESVYGKMYEVDKFENNEWYHLDFTEDTDFEAIGICLSPQKTNQENCKLSTLQEFKNLTTGKYRIVEEICNLDGITNVKAEFELK